MATIDEIFGEKFTENGDKSFNTTGNNLLNILFMTEYYTKHLNEVQIGCTEDDKIFAMFIRDPRVGLGKRDLGRVLMMKAGVSYAEMAFAGRYDDIVFSLSKQTDNKKFKEGCEFLRQAIINGNELAKKWMPRYSSKNLMLARAIAKEWGMNKQQYGHFIKCDTTESKLSRKTTDKINFSQVPSLALIKYYKRFKSGEDTSSRFGKYLESVKSGKSKMNVSTTTVYDIYRNREAIDPDLFFDKIEKVSGNWLPIVDTSGSMEDANDSFGKALSVGHYLSKCSTYAPNKVLSFSSHPILIELGVINQETRNSWWGNSQYLTEIDSMYTSWWYCNPNSYEGNSQYLTEIDSMYTGDCSNTDFGAVMRILQKIDKDNAPEYLIVLSDMEFDRGSSMSKDETIAMFRANGINTKIVWWNFNSRSKTCPETDRYGNIYLSGYSPMLLKFLEAGFDGNALLKKLLEEYKKHLK